MIRIGYLALAAVGACSEPSISIDAYPAAWLETSCEYLVRCGVTTSIESCHETRAENLFSSNLLAAVAAGTVRWNGDAAEDCVGRLEQLSCDRTSESYRHLGCERYFTGTLGKDAACTLSAECVSNECWTEGCTDACCVGYCTGDIDPEIGEIDGPCRLSGCVAGARCEDSVCVPLRTEGEACTYEFEGECAYGLACINKLCTAPVESGESCSIASECRMIGESCSIRGTCGPIGQLGDLCSSGNHCAPHLVCGVTSHCAPAPRIGEACRFFDDCYDAEAICDAVTNVCTRPKPDGAACEYSHECASYYCFDGACISCMGN